MRENTKWIMLILTVAFIGWLVFDWVQGRGGVAGTEQNPVVGVVANQEIRYAEWNRYLSNQLEVARQENPGALTDQARYEIEEQAWDQMVSELLIQQELERLGIQVTDAEIRQAFRMSPPPSLRSHPAFQTNGQFDIQKYREYFQSGAVNQQLLLQIEDYYRQMLPRSTLFQLVNQEVYVTDDELWNVYRRENETATVRFVSRGPGEMVPADAVSVTDDEVRSYYQEHRDEEFSRPATATVRIVSLPSGASPEDTAAVRARADSLRDLVVSGERDYGSLAGEVSADTATAEDGGLVGEVALDQLSGALRRAVDSLAPGRISDPVLTPSGFQLLRVDERRADTVRVRHIVIPIQPSMETEDRLFDRMDRLEGIALREGLAAAADSVGLSLRDSVVLSEGSTFVPGAGALGVGVDWALNPTTEVGELSQFFENSTAFHLLELVDRHPAGTRSLEEVRGEIRERLRREKMEEEARERMEAFAAAAREAGDLEGAARERGWEVRTAGPFTRADFVDGLGRSTEAVGAAFGLEPGRVSGALDAGERVAVIQVMERTPADRSAFRTELASLRARVTQERQRAWVDRWMAELREDAEVQDLRHVLDQQAEQAAQQGGRAGM
jgi:peptidyl-prolyl cis-trans isomerase D